MLTALMGYVNQRVARLRAKLKRIRAAIATLDATLIESATTVESYSFDSGEGSQRVTRRKLNEIREQIDLLESQEARIINELYGMGTPAVKLRRKRPNYV